jgi:hypothetical protein
VVLLALSVVASFAGGVLAGARETRGNRWVIPVFVIIGFLNAYLPAYTVRRELRTIDVLDHCTATETGLLEIREVALVESSPRPETPLSENHQQ